eukprot:1155549-Pelagomonas_calceolata.AAC.4
MVLSASCLIGCLIAAWTGLNLTAAYFASYAPGALPKRILVAGPMKQKLPCVSSSMLSAEVMFSTLRMHHGLLLGRTVTSGRHARGIKYG